MDSKKLLIYGVMLCVIPLVIGVSAGLYVSGMSPLSWFEQQSSKDRSVRESTNQDLEGFGLGYVGGRATSDRERGILTHDRENTAKGKNFYCGDHGYRAFLMDMAGEVLHRWHYSFEKAFGYKNKRNPKKLAELGKERPDPSWSKCHLFEDGSVLALIRDRGLVKIDRNSNLLWKQEIQAHHDFWVGESGIYVLMRQVNSARRMYKRPDDKFEEKFVEDFIVHLSHDGEIVDRYSLLQMIVDSTYQPLLFHTVVGFEVEKPILRTKDVLHPNSVQILFPGSPIHERLTKVQGPLALVSMKAVDSVALFSLQKREMVWNLAKNSHTQHDARLLPNGNILLFDNWGNHSFQFSPEVRLIHDDFSSRVLELDPFSQEVVWKYGDNENEQFFSQCCGRNQRLSNGNTLITHTKKGRAFEVTEEGEVVWEYVNPANSVRRKGKVASLYLERIERELEPFWKD